MTSRDLVRRLLDHGCVLVRQRGSHARYLSPCGNCATTVPIHAGRDLPGGTLKAIERDMTPCLGSDWLKRR